MAMAETDTNKDGKVSFQDDPLKYCNQCYDEAAERLDDLMDENKENRLFYEGIDPVLEARKNDKRVERSAIFVPLIKPAIDTRMSGVNSRLDLKEFPISIKSTLEKTDEKIDTQVALIEREINEQMRSCGYLPTGFMEHCTAAEMYRMAVVKVGWEDYYESVPEVVQPSIKQQLGAFFGRKDMPKPTVKFRRVKRGRPYAEYLDPDAFLYQPNQSSFEKSEYCGHRVWLDIAEIRHMAEEYEWDVKKIDEFEAGIGSDNGSSENHSDDAFRDEIEDEKGTAYEKGSRDGKHLLVEWYVCTYNKDGEEEIRQVIVLANKYLLKNRTAPIKGVRFPFVIAIANDLPGTIEGMSSIEIGKQFQRLYNEIFNSYLDGVTYRIFPPFLADAGFKFEEAPVYGPARIWRTPTPDGIKPLIENPGQLPDLPNLMGSVAESFRNMMNANDLDQGMNSNPYEKATAAKLRTMGSTQRSSAVQKRYGLVLAKVAKMFLALNQQFGENPTFFVADVIVDAPTLTNVTDEEAEKQEAILLLSQAMQNPLYQNPVGQRKIRNMLEDVFIKFKKTDVFRYVPTVAEFETVLGQQAQMQDLMLQKQGMQEQMAMEQGAAQQMESANGTGKQQGSILPAGTGQTS